MKYLKLILLLALSTGLQAQGVKVSSYGFDDPATALYKAMISLHDTLIIDRQAGEWVLPPMRFQSIRNKVILLEKGVVLRAKPGAFRNRNDVLLKFLDCENITILGTGNLLTMNKEEYTDGEWRHNIRLGGCKNITIRNLTLSDSGGDGIMIGKSGNHRFSENIVLDSIHALNNKRQGITIASGKHIEVTNSVFADTRGTMPGAGVDIEPDHPEDVISDILFRNCAFTQNFHAGIKVALGRLQSVSDPVSIRFTDCVLSNNADPANSAPHAEIFIVSHNTDPVSGLVQFENCRVENSQWPFLYARKSAGGFTVEFKDCTARNICQGLPAAAIYLDIPNDRSSNEVGGLVFDDLRLEYDVRAPFFMVRNSFPGNGTRLRNIRGRVTLPSKVPAAFGKMPNRNPDGATDTGVDLKIQYNKVY